jgi:hypothetical protein
MSVVIRIHGWANGLTCHVAGQWIKSVDVQKAPLTEEWLITTTDIMRAYRWEDKREALETYYEVLESDPIRPDGKPNRPLTALTIEIQPAPLGNGDFKWR